MTIGGEVDPQAIRATGDGAGRHGIEKASVIVDEYSSFVAVDDLNGRLTLGENTADNGARIA